MNDPLVAAITLLIEPRAALLEKGAMKGEGWPRWRLPALESRPGRSPLTWQRTDAAIGVSQKGPIAVRSFPNLSCGEPGPSISS